MVVSTTQTRLKPAQSDDMKSSVAKLGEVIDELLVKGYENEKYKKIVIDLGPDLTKLGDLILKLSTALRQLDALANAEAINTEARAAQSRHHTQHSQNGAARSHENGIVPAGPVNPVTGTARGKIKLLTENRGHSPLPTLLLKILNEAGGWLSKHEIIDKVTAIADFTGMVGNPAQTIYNACEVHHRAGRFRRSPRAPYSFKITATGIRDLQKRIEQRENPGS